MRTPAFLPSATAAVAAAPDLALAAVFLLAWIAPFELPHGMLGWLVLVVLLEFIIVHSSAFMGNVALGKGTRRARALAVLGLGGFYTLFVGAFSLAFHTWWPLVSFWGLTLNRMLGLLVGQAHEGEARLFVQRSWAVGAMAYLGAVFATVLLPVPRLGLGEDVVSAQSLPGSGLWIEEPHRAIAAGVLYFAAVGASELVGHRWLPASHLPHAKADAKPARSRG